MSDNSLGKLSLNWPQRNFFFPLQRGVINSANLIWGRGTAKSSSIALLIRHIVLTMPRSNWVIQGATFQQLLTRTLPGTLAFMEKFGWKRDRDYFINKMPTGKAANYLLPYECPLKPENMIFFVNHRHKYAVGFTLFSQDRSSGRGPNRDGIICDESLLLDYDKFSAETLATNRGNRQYFRDSKLHHGVFHFSSMPTGEHWLLSAGNYYGKENLFQDLRKEIINLDLIFCREKDIKTRLEIWQKRIDLCKQLKFAPSSEGQFYSEFDTFDNVENLGFSYIDQMYKDMPEHIFMIEMLNKRTSKIEHSFYPHLDRDKHCYKGHYDYNHLDNLEFDFNKLSQLNSDQDLDVNPDLPLDAGLDFGVNINWMVVGQYQEDKKQYNFLKNIYLKSPNTIDDVANSFCDYYDTHRNKVLYLYPDAEGNIRRPNAINQSSYVDQMKQIMRRRGWSIIVKAINTKNVLTREHYITWSRCLSETNDRYPRIRFNLINCKELIYSMEQTPAKDYGGGDIRKDKGSEKNFINNREQATDAGDAADKIIYTRFNHLNRVYTNLSVPLA